MPDLPSGTVTFLFTDIEGSTKLAQAHPAEWEVARQRHHAILKQVMEAHHGYMFQVIGDAFCVAFATAADALAAAVETQRALRAETWGKTPIHVRMGLHTGTAELRGGDYQGYLTLAHVQRVMSAAYGGQLLLSGPTAQLVRAALPAGCGLRDLGEHHLKGIKALERLWQLLAPDLRQDFPPLASFSAIPNNLPIQTTSFIGRAKEIEESKRLLGGGSTETAHAEGALSQSTRLLTLTGPGGTGKTRLSLEVATQLLEQFPDGAWFVELASLSDPTYLPQTVTSALGLAEQPGRPLLSTLQEYVSDKRLLLILDNCEHLITPCALLADSLLHTSAPLKILATSREPLGIDGEAVFRVPSLPGPEPELPVPVAKLLSYDAVRLFVERARAARTDFVLTDSNGLSIAQICNRLDGIPLAIELAAARTRVFSPEEVKTRLADQFRLLVAGSRTALPRHQTLHALIDWSYRLLTEPEKICLWRLSVFAGGWNLEAAESICGGEGLEVTEIADGVTQLVEKSLVLAEQHQNVTRYRMSETVRQYAREKLVASSSSERVRTRHLDFYERMCRKFAADMPHPEGWQWLDRVETDLDNIRAAIEWSLESGQTERGMYIAGGLQWFWFQRHPREGLQHLTASLALPASARRSVARAWALNCEGYLQTYYANYEAARKSLEEALSIGRETGDQSVIIPALTWLGQVALTQGEYPSARDYLSECLHQARQANLAYETGYALFYLGDLAFIQGNFIEAQARYEECRKVWGMPGAKGDPAFPTRRLGQVALRRNSYAEARTLIQKSLSLNILKKDRRGIAASIASLAAVVAYGGAPEAAIQLYGAVDGLLESMKTRLLPFDDAQYQHYLAALRTQVDEPTFSAAWEAGRAISMDQAIRFALDNDLPYPIISSHLVQ